MKQPSPDPSVTLDALEPILARVMKPARYVGGEFNQVVKPPGSARARIALAFPDVYEIGVSYHGFRILYERINERDDWAAERTFAPWPDFEKGLREAGLPLATLEGLTPLREMDVIGFTLQSEINYSNALNMLDLGGLPVRRADRSDALPLVVAGGEGALAPEPMSPFIDAFVLGDAEETVLEILEAVACFKESGGDEKAALLARVGAVKGVYAPALLDERADAGEPPVYRRRVWDVSTDPGPRRPIVPNLRAVHDRKVIEIRRGCARGCRFCHAGMTNRPVRERTPARISEIAREGLMATGYADLSLLSLSATDHTRIREIVEGLMAEFGPRRVSVSLPSLRLDSFDIGLAAEISKVRKTGFTFAPEAGSERLRAVINKELKDDDIVDLARQVFERGWSTLKLYFMIGLPTETEEDIDGIVDLCRRIEAQGRRVWKKRLRINVTLSPFVPKPHTPFQWSPQAPRETLEERFARVREGIRSRQMDVKFANPEQSILEAALARGDRRVGRAIEVAWRGGARFDGWSEQFRFDVWREAFASVGLDIEAEAGRERDVEEALPWDHIDVGVGKAFLLKEWELARRGVVTPDCTLGECAGCRACQGGDGHRLANAAPAVAAKADTPAEAASFPETGGAGRRTPEGRRGRGQGRGKKTGAAPEDRRRVRLYLSKRGRLRFTSHLDFQEVLIASILRAGLPVAWSEGFHPHPQVSLPPPLSLGYEADFDPIEVTVAGSVEPKSALKALNGASPEGLRFEGLDVLSSVEPPMSRKFIAASYRVTFPPETARDASAREALARFEQTEVWPHVKKTKKGEREIDLKTSVQFGDWEGETLDVLVSLLEGRYIDPLAALAVVLGREVSVAEGFGVGRRRIVM